MASRPAESPSSPRRINAAERRRRALELRRDGLTLQQIADELGIRSKGHVSDMLKQAIAAIPRAAAEELVAITLERYDAAVAAVMPKVVEGDLGAIRELLRTERDRARLLGLNELDARMVAAAERKVALEEAQVTMLLVVINRVLDALGLTPEQVEVAATAVPNALRLVGGVDPETVSDGGATIAGSIATTEEAS